MKRKLLLTLIVLYTSSFVFGQLSENFDGSSFPPTGWTAVSGSGAWDQSNEVADHTTGTASFARYDCYNISGATAAELITPTLDVTTGDKTFSFWANYYLVSGTWGSAAELYVDVTADDGNTWTQGTTNYIAGQEDNGWLQTSIDLGNYEGQNFVGSSVKVRFRAISDYGSYDIGIDDVLGPALYVPACPAPTNQVETNKTTTSVDLGWTEAGSATLWDIEWGPAGFTQGTGTTITGVTANPYTLSGLTAGTSYEWYVRSDCGGGSTSTWTGSHGFETLPGPHPFPLTEDFESGFTYFNNAPNNTNDFVDETTLFHGGAHSVHNAYTPSNSDILHETGVLDLSTTTHALLEFWQIAKTEGSFDKCYIEISTDGGSTYTALPGTTYQGSGSGYASAGYFDEDDYTTWGTGTEIPDNTWWKKETFNLSAYNTTNVRIRFRLTSDGSVQKDGWYLDDISVYEPSCPYPSNQIESNITSSSANLGWTENGSATTWEIMIDTANFDTTAYSHTSTTSNPYNATGLVSSTSYDWYVRASCGSGSYSVWIGPSTFTTYPPALSIPFTHDFESNSFGTYIQADTSTESRVYIDAAAANSSSYGAYMEGNTASGWSGGSSSTTESQAWNDNTTHISEMNMRVEATSVSVVQLKFDLKQTYSYGAKYSWFRVVVNDTVQIGNSYNPASQNGDAFDTKTIDLSAYAGTTFNLSLQHSGKYNNANGTGTPGGDNAYVDNIAITAPTCPNPDDLSEDNIKLNAVKLHWRETGSSTTWNVRIGETGFDTTGVTYYTVTIDTFLTVDTLLASTGYEWYVRSSCGGGDYSDWVKSSAPFTTSNGKATGPYPSDGADSILVTSDTLEWNPVPNATKYVLNIGTTSGGHDILENGSLTDTIYTGSNWNYSTQYFWTVNTVYNGTNDTVTGTEWDFTTECGVYTPEYNQGFTTYLPICWSEATGYLKNPTTLTGTTSNWSQDDFGNDASNGKSARLEIWSTTKKDWLFSPSIDLSGGSYQLEFDLALTHYSNTASDTLGTDDTLAVVISTDNGATWNLSNALRIWTHSDYISNTGDHITIDLSSYSSTVKFGFYGSSTVSNKDNNVYVDNFKVRTPPACPEPISLSQDSIKLNSAKLYWKENGSATTWNVRIGTTGFDTTGAAYYTVVADTFLTVDTLLASTSYEWYVRASCGAGSNSVWVKSPTSFTTLDGVVTGPYPTDGAFPVAVGSDTLEWNPVDNATKYILNIGTTSGGNDVLADHALTDTIFITGSNWDYATQYYWTVNTVYNGTSDTVNGTEWSFSTECNAVTVPYFQDFDGVTVPVFPMCMTVENTNGDSYTWETSTTHHSAPNAAKIRWNSSAAMNDWFFTRGLNLSKGVTYQVNFMYRAQSSSYPEKLEVDWGNAASSTAMSGSPVFVDNNIVSTSWLIGSATFTPTTSGVYYVGFHGFSDANMYDLYVDDIQVVQYQLNTTWVGTMDNDWRNENNWSNGIPPGSLTDVTIPTGKTYYPTITKTAYCKSVTIESDASGDASLIGAGNIVSVNADTVKRYIPSDSVWHEVSAMTTGATIESYYFNHSPDVWMEEYIEATDSRTPVFDLITDMPIGKGFEIWVDTGFTITATFEGALRGTDVILTDASTPPLSFTDVAHGYNLLGNPFSSAISWDSVYMNGLPANIDNEVWVWSPASGNYKTYTGAGGPLTNGIIPMGQGFFIHVNAVSPGLTIPTSAQVHSNQAFYSPIRESKQHLTLSVNKGQKNDEVMFAFNSSYTDKFDTGFDGIKLMGSKKAPQLYVVTEEDKKLSIDALPPVHLGDAKVIKLFFKAGETGDQVLIAQDIDKLEGVKVYLEDLKLGVTQLLNDKPVYNFFATYYQNPDRFRLHFERDVDGISSLSKQNNIRAYAYGKRLYIVSDENAAKATKLITLFDITGRKILEKQLPPGELVSVPVTVSNTYAVVRVITNGEVYTTKVFIK